MEDDVSCCDFRVLPVGFGGCGRGAFAAAYRTIDQVERLTRPSDGDRAFKPRTNAFGDTIYPGNCKGEDQWESSLGL